MTAEGEAGKDHERAILGNVEAGEFGSIGRIRAERVTVVLPSGSPPELREGYRELAQGWADSQPGAWSLVEDEELKTLPVDAAVWVLGWENRWRDPAYWRGFQRSDRLNCCF